MTEKVVEITEDTKLKDNPFEMLHIYAIYDEKSDKFDTPFFAHNEIFAKRRCIMMAEDEKSPLQMWPKDFSLYRVGKFNITTGHVFPEKEMVFEFASVVRPK